MIMLCCFNASIIVVKTVQSHTEEVPYTDLKFHKRKAQKSVSNPNSRYSAVSHISVNIMILIYFRNEPFFSSLSEASHHKHCSSAQ